MLAITTDAVLRGLALLRRAALAGGALLALAPADAGAAHRHGARRHASLSGPRVIQCVAFARAASDVALPGNAVNWWQNAEGIYARGAAPEVGSVLNFRANARMRLGHVAVVAAVVDGRTIEIDQSHWNARGISRSVSVVDVSDRNDWTAVRVELGHGGTYGSIYPTYGFIYPRADRTGRILTARSDVRMRHLGAAPSDLRGGTEVAEMPALAGGTDLSGAVLSDDAPNRALR